LLTVPTRAQAPAGRFITLASSTAIYQSGLFAHLLPLFTRETGIGVQLVVFGDGGAIEAARRGDVDVVFVRNAEAEERFVSEGFADPAGRQPVMYHDFVIVGPRRDPAGIAGSPDSIAALRRIAASGALFVSRGDRSGSHAAEKRLWREAGIVPAGAWYRETGQGMGPTLTSAARQDAYTLTDRGTWLAFRNLRTLSSRGSLTILVEGDQRLLNPYAVIVVSPDRHPHAKAEEARLFADWLLSPAGQQAIAGYRLGGEPLFFAHAGGSSG
jgi:tungstate transport system substrate-binding protein